MDGPSLELRDVTRRFDDVVAVRQVSLELTPACVHGLVGENGAGKSTALKMLAGHLAPSSGRVLVDGAPLQPATAAQGYRCGIGMVHQHFMLVEAFTALENLMLGSEPVGPWGRLDLTRARQTAANVAEDVGLTLDLDRPVADLAVSERQRLEILRVLYRGARALLLDEPTAVLSPSEVDQLYQTLRRLAQRGATIAVVTHRLDEVVRFCDVVSVMRRGELTHHETIPDTPAEGAPPGAERSELAERVTRAIMGADPPPAPRRPERSADAAEALRLKEISVLGRAGAAADQRLALDRMDLTVDAGEIVGVAGVGGNGQHELARALAGLEPLTAGAIEVDGAQLFAGTRRAAGRRNADSASRVRTARERGLVVVHEDRQRDELVLAATVADNLALGDLGRIDEPDRVAQRFARFDIQPPDPTKLARQLSGGNQQKVVMARALDRTLRVLVLAQPTRGVDIAAAGAIHHAIIETAARGVAVVLISADLSELRALSHRIVVIRRGRVVAEFAPTTAERTIGRAMLGTEQRRAASGGP